MIYLDSSALLKMLFEEQESGALAQWISAQTGTALVSSEIAKVEVIRAVRRLDPAAVPAARALVSQLDLIPLRGALLDEAAETGAALLRTLDAIHLASALSIRLELTAFVVYDKRLATAAQAAGLTPIQPADNSPG
ncbi:MAG TPA: type II toxin-antitoxin system VapC family toxin [Mycobacteriales bacterium]|jgi:predicted nucleic acid-binding protein|nr:type II toxin-antitoxin system VapC family toxin [Mycobacteriales bacterium]